MPRSSTRSSSSKPLPLPVFVRPSPPKKGLPALTSSPFATMARPATSSPFQRKRAPVLAAQRLEMLHKLREVGMNEKQAVASAGPEASPAALHSLIVDILDQTPQREKKRKRRAPASDAEQSDADASGETDDRRATVIQESSAEGETARERRAREARRKADRQQRKAAKLERREARAARKAARKAERETARKAERETTRKAKAMPKSRPASRTKTDIVVADSSDEAPAAPLAPRKRIKVLTPSQRAALMTRQRVVARREEPVLVVGDSADEKDEDEDEEDEYESASEASEAVKIVQSSVAGDEVDMADVAVPVRRPRPAARAAGRVLEDDEGEESDADADFVPATQLAAEPVAEAKTTPKMTPQRATERPLLLALEDDSPRRKAPTTPTVQRIALALDERSPQHRPAASRPLDMDAPETELESAPAAPASPDLLSQGLATADSPRRTLGRLSSAGSAVSAPLLRQLTASSVEQGETPSSRAETPIVPAEQDEPTEPRTANGRQEDEDSDSDTLSHGGGFRFAAGSQQPAANEADEQLDGIALALRRESDLFFTG